MTSRGHDIIQSLGLAPHPEGGHFRETWRADTAPGERAAGTAIYFLLCAGERSRWHRIDATEIWHHYAGAPLDLRFGPDRTHAPSFVLGPDIAAGQRPQIVIPPHQWQMASARDDFTLVGCTVSPGFQFDGFELAP